MGIEKLKGSLLSEAEKDARKIVEEAQSEAKTLLESERAEKAQRKKAAESEVERLLEEQRNERLAWARLESKRILAEAKEDAMKGVLEDFFAQLQEVRKSPEYKKVLNSAVPAAVNELGR